MKSFLLFFNETYFFFQIFSLFFKNYIQHKILAQVIKITRYI